MADYIQLELFDAKPYISGKTIPDIYMLAQAKKPEEVTGQQLEINLFPDEPEESYFDLKRAA